MIFIDFFLLSANINYQALAYIYGIIHYVQMYFAQWTGQ